MNIIKHSAAAGCSCLYEQAHYAGEWDGRLPQYESIPTTAEQSSSGLSQPSHPVMGSFTLSAHSHDWLENSNRLPSPGRPHLTDIILSDLRSELACSSFSVVGRHSCLSARVENISLAPNPLSHNPPPVFISAEWKKKQPVICS